MKNAFSAIDMYMAAKELQILAKKQAKIDQIYVHDPKHAVIRFYVPQIGKKTLIIQIPHLLMLAPSAATPLRPPGITLHLRKLLTGARVREVRAIPLERLLIIDVEKEVPRQIIIEFQDKGNLIVTENNTIKACLENQQWSNRSVRPSQPYISPQREVTFLQQPSLLQADTNLSKSLATNAGLGGEYAAELLARTHLDGNHPAQLSEEQLSILVTTLKELLEEYAPRIYLKDPHKGITKDNVLSINAHQMTLNAAKQDHSSFLEAIHQVYGQKIQQEEKKVKKSKQERIRDAMLAQEKQFEKSQDQFTQQGEFIYENYALLQQILEDVRSREKQGDVQTYLDETYGKKKVTYNASQRTITYNE